MSVITASPFFVALPVPEILEEAFPPALSRSMSRAFVRMGRTMETAALHPELSSFAEELRRFRRDRRMTQEELAELAGMSVRTVRNVETGRVSRPRRASIARLAAALDLSPEDEDRLGAAALADRRPVLGETGSSAHFADPPSGHGTRTVYLDMDSRVLLVFGRGSVIEVQLGLRWPALDA
jgi:transcriptional regulator with XRE-family HTH domain